MPTVGEKHLQGGLKNGVSEMEQRGGGGLGSNTYDFTAGGGGGGV
jgi:hypothetical protein